MTSGDEFADAVILITGAARGQGAAMARAFARRGARVIACDVEEPTREVAASVGDGYRFRLLDVRDAAGWERVVAETVNDFGAPLVLVNNAGVMRAAPITEMLADDIRMVIDVNLVGTLLGMRAVGRAMADAGRGGVIINISSTSGFRGGARTAAYAASKWGVRGATRAAAADLAPHGIRVVSVHPGAIATDMLASSGLSDDQIVARHGDRLLLGRVGQADETAAVVVFLASRKASYMTGSEFVIDGGLTANYGS